MLDRFAIKLIKPPLNQVGEKLHRLGVTADQVTIVGFVFGLLAFACIALGQPMWGLLFLVLNRLCDGLDGAIARVSGITDAGGFLDISLDFLFYALIPLGFVIADPAANGVAGAVLLTSFIGTGTSFLAFASLASKHGIENPVYQHKSIYYLGGIAEGTETILCFALFCLFPASFALIAYVFASLCAITIATRIGYGYQTLKQKKSG
uniref:CDP-alcohol phosphatidyltransferase family protein n=1 Tax=Thaumasiovibrio occultus TaxID=1891184 RepID=UPI000B35E648|nr:CDP-alcohol phosphatidyltransferase family protein [Thaumasiovibrio occultus]